MIYLEEIPVDNINEFWKIQNEYFVADLSINDQEEMNYFLSDEYRTVIYEHMLREEDKHHLAYFVENSIRIGAVSYCIYQNEDGKCFILDFWVFPQFRGYKTGHRCFEAFEKMTQKDGTYFYELNCDGRDGRIRFCESNGFIFKEKDKFGIGVYIKNVSQGDKY